MKNSQTKAFIVIVLTGMALMSMLAIGICLWTAWVLYLVNAFKSCVFMCVTAASFLAYQTWVVTKNKGEILKDLKELWNGNLKL